MDLDDIEHRKRRREIAALETGSLLDRLELSALEGGELRTIRACSSSFVCSQADNVYLASRGLTNTTIVPNAIRFTEKAPDVRPADDPPTLFFIGTYRYAPNAEAAEYLIGQVFPLIRRVRSDVRLSIVGTSAEVLPGFKCKPAAVDFVGFVTDLGEAYRRATIVCCPIPVGGGTRVKIIEAAAEGKPIGSTTIGAEGLELVDGTEILLRDSPEAFANACIELLNDPRRAKALGLSAFAKAKRLYERRHIVEHIAESYERHSARRSDPAMKHRTCEA